MKTIMNIETLRFFTTSLLLFLFVCGQISTATAQEAGSHFDDLTKGKTLHGFRTDAVYLDDADKPIGGRFTHIDTGFTLDLLQIQSVPQAYIYTNTFLVSDMGEPHTQEHLLIAKGNKGRNINVAEAMSLTGSNASTYQTYTDYPFNTAGGAEVFYARFADYMDTLLHPDYTDEEVGREVRNWGVAENPDKTLKIEEKGSVYNEMTSSMSGGNSRAFDRMGRILFGENHPLSLNAGGDPAGIRKLTAVDIRKYHDTNYHLANMGAVAALPKSMTPDDVLTRLDGILTKAEPGGGKRAFPTFAKLPAPSPAKPGTIEIVDYPSDDAQTASTILFAFPALNDLSVTERALLENFMNVFAGDASSNLYKKFIDSKTRVLDTGAKGLFNNIPDEPMTPTMIALTSVPAENLTVEKATAIRQSIGDEVRRIAAFKDGSPELKEFNDRFRNAIADYKRSLSKRISAPPGFGFRNGDNGNTWLWHLRNLNSEPGFKRSVTLKPQFAEIDALLASGKNFWRDRLGKWGYMTDAFVTVAHPEPKLVLQEETERKGRAAAEIGALKERFGVSDEQEAIRQYKAAYDKTTAQLEALEQGTTARFIDKPPLTLDDQLDYHESTVGTVKVGDSTFDNMTGATTGISIRLDSVPQDDLVYLTSLPNLLRNTGVVVDGKPMSYEDMSQLLQKEILNLNAGFTSSSAANRYELTVRGSGNDAGESERAVLWMERILKSPNWTEGNLPRIRDVLDQSLSGYRRRMQGAEENWVTNPSEAYRLQERPLHLATQSFLTQSHNVFRLRWMLKAGGGPGIDKYLETLSQARGTRDELQTLAKALQGDNAATAALSPVLKSFVEQKAGLTGGDQAIAVEAAKDLADSLAEIPDATLAADWASLCGEMRFGLAQGPVKTLANLNALRGHLLDLSKTRMFYVGSAATRQRLAPAYSHLLTGFEVSNAAKASYTSTRLIDERLSAHAASTGRPVYVGLLAPNMTGGVIINSAPLAGYADTGRDKILDFLAARLYGGAGAHAVFTKTINAGLAYSNGIGSSPESGRVQYYAERTPLIPQTLGFVIGEIKRPMDRELDDYVISLSFFSNAASSYEVRGEGMAANMTDGLTPDVVATFRKAILEARKMPDLSKQLYARKDRIYERILPGYGVKGREVGGANFFSIGPEKQLSAYEGYLKNAEGQDTRLQRLYPRDFWLIQK